MKKSFKVVLCLALAVMMLACTALAAVAQENVAAAGGTTIEVTDGKFSVTTSGTAGEQYVLFLVKPIASVTGDTAAALLADAQAKADAGTQPYLALDEKTILYIDQVAGADSKVTFTEFLPKSTSTCLFVVTGGTEGASKGRIVGAMVTQGVNVTGTVTAKGATAATVTAGDASEDVTLTNGTGTYALSGVAADTTTLTVSSSAANNKFVTREYTIDASADVTQDVVICPRGDANGDGVINGRDYNAVLSHVRNLSPITDTYLAACAAKANGDSVINGRDYNAILSHVRGLTALW